jgi:hypothetical protein
VIEDAAALDAQITRLLRELPRSPRQVRKSSPGDDRPVPPLPLWTRALLRRGGVPWYAARALLADGAGTKRERAVLWHCARGRILVPEADLFGHEVGRG